MRVTGPSLLNPHLETFSACENKFYLSSLVNAEDSKGIIGESNNSKSVNEQ